MKGSVVVNEIFTSIQGESLSAGRPCTFVRLTGCNLRCSYCDTAYAFHEGHERRVAEVVEEVLGRSPRFVTVTGGEPLLQDGAFDLVTTLLDRGCEVQVETSGAVDTAGLDPRARVILDVKTPGSGESGKTIPGLLPLLRPGDEAKFVVVDRADYEFARNFLREGRIPRGVAVLLSPAHGELEPKALAAWILEDGLEVRLQLQIHKYIWGKESRGV
jgi:7-carboxy-7-deazaguanine synthase